MGQKINLFSNKTFINVRTKLLKDFIVNNLLSFINASSKLLKNFIEIIFYHPQVY